MIMCTFPFWPVEPVMGLDRIGGIIALVGVIFSIIMLIDCLKRQPGDFNNPLSKDGAYDKLIWALAIVLSFSLYFVGAIVYYFVVKRGKPKEE